MAQYGTSVISELTQWSGSLTCLASDLGQACQKYVCRIPFQVAYVSQRMMPMIDHRRNLSRSGHWPNLAKKWCPLPEDFVSLRTLTKYGPNCAPHWRTLSHSKLWPNVVQNAPLVEGLCLTADFNQMWAKMCPSLEDFISQQTLTRCGPNMCSSLEDFVMLWTSTKCGLNMGPLTGDFVLLRSLTKYGSTTCSSSKKASTKQIGL